jgi:hypothetical protein
MPAPLIAPLVLTAVAAASAGWFGSRWWKHLRGEGERIAGGESGRRPPTAPVARNRPQTMLWCAACGTYVSPARPRECLQPRCRFRK